MRYYASWIVLALLGKSLSKPFKRVQSRGITSDAATFSQSAFDYVIVGGGTAGLILAARLSEDVDVSVGVIEAGVGHFDDALVDTPARFGQAWFNPDYDWAFQTVPQAELNGRSVAMNRGKMLGGSSGIGLSMWQRASRGDYDNWSVLGVGGGWNWEGLLPYFEKTENVTVGPADAPFNFTQPAGTGAGEGRSGPLPISYNSFYGAYAGPYSDSLTSLGVALNSDPDNGDTSGFFNCPASVDSATGNRTYSANSYLLPNTARPNLAVLVGAQATKIEFSAATYGKNATAIATGVQLTADGKNWTVSAHKEVILSAGTFQTPQLLELSGIGDQDRLTSLGIPVIFANPAVGENLQDHTLVQSFFLLSDPLTPTFDMLFSNASFQAQANRQYLSNHTGIFTYTPSPVSVNPLQQFWSPAELASALSKLQNDIDQANVTTFAKKQYKIQIDSINQGKLPQMELTLLAGAPGQFETEANATQNFIDILSVGSMPFSRGSVHIETTDPLTPPLIDANYLQFDFDKQVLTKGTQIARRLSQTAPLSSFISGPLAPSTDVSSEDDFSNFVVNNIATEWNVIGTASLGPLGEGGVVSDELIVYGTSNVRVVDASVMPLHIATHIQATVYAIAEKAADMIKGSH